MHRFGAGGVLLVAAGVACGERLPPEDRIASLRPLALRVEVIDAAADPEDPVRVEGLPVLDRVRLVPFIVDGGDPLTPEDITAEMEPVWLACALPPGQGLFSCLSSRLPLAPVDVEVCPELDLGGIDPSDPTSLALPSPCRLEGGTPGQPEFPLPVDVNFLLGGDLEVTMVAHVPDRGSTEDCLEALLGDADERPDPCVTVVQRVPIGPADRLLALAESFGVAVPGSGPPPPPTEPDANPRITSFVVQVFEGDERPAGEPITTTRGQVITATENQLLKIRTEAPEDDLQDYYVPRDENDYDVRTERYSGRWFRTWGSLQSPTSDDPVSLNQFRLQPGEADEGEDPPERTTLYYVLRDDRQGVDWWWIHIDVAPAP